MQYYISITIYRVVPYINIVYDLCENRLIEYQKKEFYIRRKSASNFLLWGIRKDSSDAILQFHDIEGFHDIVF
jgi:hypothetical protein